MFKCNECGCALMRDGEFCHSCIMKKRWAEGRYDGVDWSEVNAKSPALTPCLDCGSVIARKKVRCASCEWAAGKKKRLRAREARRGISVSGGIEFDNIVPVSVEVAEAAIQTVKSAKQWSEADRMEKRLKDYREDNNVF